MKNEVLYLLLDNYADHEAVFLSTALACDERAIKEHPKYVNKTVAPTPGAVRSCSGFRTLPDYSFDTMPDDYAALVLVGGFGWLDEEEADKVVPLVRRAIGKEFRHFPLVGRLAVSVAHAHAAKPYGRHPQSA